MAPIAEAFVRLRPDVDRFGPDLTSTVGRSIDGSSRTLGSRFSKGFGTALKVGAVGVGTAFIAAAGGISKFVADARESEKIGRLTAAVVKSTGQAANITAKGVGNLATAISNKTGADDEAVQAGANLLLTFTHVRNEVGKGNDIFNQATQSATDMAAALGTEPKRAALQLGKALNDPIKGVTALSRSGVSFTEQQKEQIKTLVESGKTLDAQKVILGEVGKEFGGAARAASDPKDRLKVILGNLSETIGSALLPYIDKAATFVGKFVAQMTEGEGAGGKFRDIAGDIGGVVKDVAGFLRDDAVPALKDFAGFVQREVIPRLRDFAGFFRAEILPRVREFVAFIRDKVAPVVGKVLAAAFDGAKSAIDTIRDAIDRNRPQLESMLDTFRKVADFVVTKVIPVLGPILREALKQVGRSIGLTIDAVGFLWDAFQTMLRIVSPIIRTFANLFLGALDKVIGAAASVADALGFDGLADKLRGAQDKIKRFRDGVNRTLDRLAGDGYRAGKDFADGIAEGIRDGGSGISQATKDSANRIEKVARDTLEERSPSRVGHRIGAGFSDGVTNGIREAGRVTAEAARKVADDAVNALEDRLTKVRARIADLKGAAAEVRSSVAEAVRGSFDIGSLRAGPGALFDVKAIAAKASAFAKALGQLARAKIAPSLIEQIALAGPEAGMPVAQSFLALGKGQVRELNAAYQQIDRAANRAGQAVANAQDFRSRIAHERKVEDKLERLIAAVRAKRKATLTVKGDEDAARAVRRSTLALDY